MNILNNFSDVLQKLERRQSTMETIDWTPGKKGKMAGVLTIGYTSEEEVDLKHPQRQRTVVPIIWDSQELAFLKSQLDDHECEIARRSGRGVRQPLIRGQGGHQHQNRVAKTS